MKKIIFLIALFLGYSVFSQDAVESFSTLGRWFEHSPLPQEKLMNCSFRLKLPSAQEVCRYRIRMEYNREEQNYNASVEMLENAVFSVDYFQKDTLILSCQKITASVTVESVKLISNQTGKDVIAVRVRENVGIENNMSTTIKEYMYELLRSSDNPLIKVKKIQEKILPDSLSIRENAVNFYSKEGGQTGAIGSFNSLSMLLQFLKNNSSLEFQNNSFASFPIEVDSPVYSPILYYSFQKEADKDSFTVNALSQPQYSITIKVYNSIEFKMLNITPDIFFISADVDLEKTVKRTSIKFQQRVICGDLGVICSQPENEIRMSR